MSADAYAHLRTAGRHLREARRILPDAASPRSPEGVLARRIEDMMERLDRALATHESERRRAVENVVRRGRPG